VNRIDDVAAGGLSWRSVCSRRRLLQRGGAASAVALAGCAGLFGSDSTSTETAFDGDGGARTNLTGTASFDASETSTVSVDDDRIEETLDSLSLAQKVGQMTQLEPSGNRKPYSMERASEEVAAGSVGSVLFGGANAPGTSAEDALEYFNNLQSTAMNETGVPLLVGIDAVHGNATVQEAAVFPHQVGVGATWNTDLAGELAAVTGRSLAASGINWTFSPVADVAHDPRWGRYYECFGEDPFAVGEFVRATVQGYESVGDGTKRVAASVKHFAGYSAPETGNDREPADISTRTLRDVVLPPFRQGVDAGAETLMANSGSVNGVPAHASEWLATTVLRDDWEFDGLLVSDWRDIHKLAGPHGVAADIEEAVEMAVTAGVDMYMAPHPDEIEGYQAALTSLVEDGAVSEDRVDEAVRRILRVKDRLGLFEEARTPVSSHEAAARDRDRDLARRAAGESLTLLFDDRSVLPLDGDDSVLVTGPIADDARRLLGGWTMAWQGAPQQLVPETVTVADGVEAAASASRDVSVVDTSDEVLRNGAELRTAAADADVAVVVLGEDTYAEGSGDRDDLSLPKGQRELVTALAETDVETVGVFVTGRPRGSPSLFDGLDAALMAYYPGVEGGTAVADVLFGERDPAGRLPFTWPEHVGQLPQVVTHRTPPDGNGTDGERPLFPFGHGESYASVTYEGISLPGQVPCVADRRRVTATVDLSNGSDRATAESVVLLADHEPDTEQAAPPAIPPARQVVGFERVELAAGEEKSVEVPISLRALAVTDGGMTGAGERVVPAGTYELRTPDDRLPESDALRIAETAPLD